MVTVKCSHLAPNSTNTALNTAVTSQYRPFTTGRRWLPQDRLPCIYTNKECDPTSVLIALSDMSGSNAIRVHPTHVSHVLVGAGVSGCIGQKTAHSTHRIIILDKCRALWG